MSAWNSDRGDPCAVDCSTCGTGPTVLYHVTKDFHLLKCGKCGRKSTISERGRGDAVLSWNYANTNNREKG
tara:strand:+ start:1131 stop:1343 length:213 start_codon:yes stop_codon:yes gene_type:complete